MARKVRVRFAPSPTGGLHIGGVRTALYNYLFAKKMGGKMVLRIEDTDRNRFVEGAEAYIGEALSWCGIIPDESPEVGGPFGPYRQSERLNIYTQYTDQLLAEGKAYYAFDTSEELDAMRERLKAEKNPVQQYAIDTRMSMRNSLTLDEDEVKKLLADNTPYVIRLKVPAEQQIKLNDIVRGEVSVLSNTIDDKILLKSDGFPTYHLANVVDDHLMEITHVIRGEEWLPSAPLHSLLYRFLGWTDTMPQFAHLPLLLKPEGSGKLSKRDADKHGFPIFPLNWTDPESGETAAGFREAGYLPEALVNFLALLGWNPGTEEELFTIPELINSFDLERIGKSGAKFDIEKARWYNEHYLRARPVAELATILQDQAARYGVECSAKKAEQITALMIERITFPQDLWNKSTYFFVTPSTYDDKLARKKWTQEGVDVLKQFSDILPTLNLQDGEQIKTKLHEMAEAKGVGFGKVMPALRLALTGSGGGPDLFSIITILGKEETRVRILQAIGKLDAR
jgi:glutamyl-tRNA synthetase